MYTCEVKACWPQITRLHMVCLLAASRIGIWRHRGEPIMAPRCRSAPGTPAWGKRQLFDSVSVEGLVKQRGVQSENPPRDARFRSGDRLHFEHSRNWQSLFSNSRR